MGEAAPEAVAAADRAGAVTGHATHLCPRCMTAVTVTGDPECGPAVHALTGREHGEDGHIVAPIDPGLLRAADVRDRKADSGALAALRLAWGDIYMFGHDEEGYWAASHSLSSAGGILRADTPEELGGLCAAESGAGPA